MSVIGSEILAGASGNQGYNIQRSLRFRSSASAYLSRTPASAGNRQTWTWSGWVKRGALSYSYPFLMSATAAGEDTSIIFTATDNLRIYNISGSTTHFDLVTTAVFRDPSAWYHVVFVMDTTNATAADRARIYVNGVRQTSFSTYTLPPLNDVGSINNTLSTRTGSYAGGSYFFDGYLAEVNFIDGQALTPSSFGQTDAVTGVWVPKKYAGTYGTNGFYLPFTNTTSATTLCYDSSGNGNNWTPNNISTTAGVTYDSMTDVPTLTSATAANYCVMNPINSFVSGSSATFTNGNMSVSIPSVGSPPRNVTSTFAVSSGKYYWEFTAQSITSVLSFGVASTAMNFNAQISTTGIFGYQYDGQKNINGTISAYGASYTTGDVLGVALDMDAGTLVFYKNNTSQGTASSALSGLTVTPVMYASGTGAASGDFNFGQRPFSYTPPTGFKAINTFNLPDPTIKKPNQYMDATTYTGNGSTQTITNAGGFQPDLVWNKDRSNAASHALFDSVRGVTKELYSNTTDAEATTSGVTSFNINGYTVGSNTRSNANGSSMVGWQWQAGKGTTSSNTSGSITSTVSVNTTAGFSVVNWNGSTSTSAQTVGHGLGVTPKMVILKNRNLVDNWFVWFSGVTSTSQNLYLNTTAAVTTQASALWGAGMTSTVCGVRPNSFTNTTGDNVIMYCWAEIAGFSKFGSYTGNGSADGPFVYCGFRPKYVMYKRTDAASSWIILDSARTAYNVEGATLWADLSSAEATYTWCDFVSNGFKFRDASNGLNNNGATYIYAAFAENPFKYSLAR